MMKDNILLLPKSWVWAKLEDIGNIASGGTPSTKHEDNFNGDIPWITPADLSNYKGKFISKGNRSLSEKGLKSSSAVLLPAGSVLFSSRAPIGYVVIASNPISTNQGFKNLILSKDIFNEYVFYYLKASKNLVERLASGTTFLEISASKFAKVPIPISPLPEQHRIVNKIEELFTRLDAGVEALYKVKAQLKRYRRAILKNAFEGKLTKEWRKANKDEIEPESVLLERIKEDRKKAAKEKYKELPSLDTSELPKLPEGWGWTRLEQISEKITDGTHFTPTYVEEGIPFVSVKDIFNGKISFNNCKYISESEHNKLIKRCHPEYLDVLITKSGTIGRTTVVKTNKPFSLFVSVALIKPFKKYMNSEFLSLSLENYINSIDIQQSVKGGVIKNLHIEDLKEIIISLPSLTEQQIIVEEIENCLLIADELKKVVEQSLKHSDRLRQSILKKAFEGKLIPQDPTDEPAEKLLKRIKEEKAKRDFEEKKRKRERLLFQS